MYGSPRVNRHFISTLQSHLSPTKVGDDVVLVGPRQMVETPGAQSVCKVNLHTTHLRLSKLENLVNANKPITSTQFCRTSFSWRTLHISHFSTQSFGPVVELCNQNYTLRGLAMTTHHIVTREAFSVTSSTPCTNSQALSVVSNTI